MERVTRLLAQADTLLHAAESALSNGTEPTAMTVLVNEQGGLHLVANSDWALDALQAERGASAAYRVTPGRDSVRVEACERGRRCVVESQRGLMSQQGLIPQRQHSAIGHFLNAPQLERHPADALRLESGSPMTLDPSPQTPHQNAPDARARLLGAYTHVLPE